MKALRPAPSLALALLACTGGGAPAGSAPPPSATPATAAPSAAPSAPATVATPSTAGSAASDVHAVPIQTLPPGSPTQLAALNGAKAALAQGKEKTALEQFRAAMQGPLTGTSVSAALAAADLMVERRHFDDAAALYKELMKAAALVPEVQFAAGRFAWERGKDADAIAALQACLALQPDFIPAWQLLGIVQARAGRDGDAGRTLTEYELRLNKFVRRSADLGLPAGERLSAIELLSTVADERAIGALVAALADPDVGVRVATARLLADEDAPEALAGLAKAALAETDPDARATLAVLLAQARHRAHREAAGPLPPMPRPAAGVAPGSAAP